jgi:hypothetical protein
MTCDSQGVCFHKIMTGRMQILLDETLMDGS